MNAIHYIGFDVHKKTISFCVKTADGQIVEEGRLQAEQTELRRWAAGRKTPSIEWRDVPRLMPESLGGRVV
jgi:transposase